MPANWTKLFTLGESGTSNTQLDGPTAVAIDKPYVYIADLGNERVLKWKLQGGDYVGKIDSIKAWSLCVVGKYLYVMDVWNAKVHKYDKATLTLVESTAPFTNLSGMTYWEGYIYVVDDTVKKVYRIDLNTMDDIAELQISGVTSAYEDIVASGNHLYMLTAAGSVYRITKDLKYDNRTVDLSAYLTDYYYISSIGDYLIISGNDSEFVLIDQSLTVIANETMDTDNWSRIFDTAVLAPHVFLAADYASDQVVAVYGYNRSASRSSGDTITIDDTGTSWNFGDDVIIGGSEENLTTETFVDVPYAHPQSRNAWKQV